MQELKVFATCRARAVRSSWGFKIDCRLFKIHPARKNCCPKQNKDLLDWICIDYLTVSEKFDKYTFID